MSLIILKHREHGTHVTGDEMEAQSCEANGWTRVPTFETILPNGEDSIVEITAAKLMAEVETVVNAMEVTVSPPLPPSSPSLNDRYIAKFGKPPHHRMLEATIRRLMDDTPI